MQLTGPEPGSHTSWEAAHGIPGLRGWGRGDNAPEPAGVTQMADHCESLSQNGPVGKAEAVSQLAAGEPSNK